MNAYFIDGIRTPIGNFTGTLSTIRTDDLGAKVIEEVVKRNPNIPKEAYDDVIMGCANQAGEDNRNVARMCSLLAGLPWTVPGETVNRLCSSGLSAIIHANRAIKAGDGDVFIAGGVEHMTRGPWVISKVSKPFGRDAQMHDSSFGWRFVNKKMKDLYGTDGMGTTAENLVDMYNISREDQDRFAYNSQMKAAKAQASGRLREEIVPIEIPQRKADPILFEKDEFIRASTTMEALAKLRPAFRKAENGGTVTAGNASGLNDGAAATLIASEDAVKKYGLKPRARIHHMDVMGDDPIMMLTGPITATKRALKRAGMTPQDIDIAECNEAFAPVPMAWMKETGFTHDQVNVNGGAIALGHPLGCSGAKLMTTLVNELERTGGKYGFQTMCEGGGLANATIIERV